MRWQCRRSQPSTSGVYTIHLYSVCCTRRRKKHANMRVASRWDTAKRYFPADECVSMCCIFSLNSSQQKRESESKTRLSCFPHSACKQRGDKSTDASNVSRATTNRNVNMSPCNLQFALSQSFAKSIVTHPIPLLPKKMASLRTLSHQTYYPAAAVFNLFNLIF